MIQILMTMAFVFVMMTLMSNMMMKKQQKKYVEKMEEYSQQYAHLDEKTLFGRKYDPRWSRFII